MFDELLTALALILVLEGVFPFLIPDRWHKILQIMAQVEPARLRCFGLVSMLTGSILLVFFK
ncbi:MAG: DUF2065 domain-containing protein [Cellvibrionales bacterium TMED49]|nr:DUF2065 domain-containing protein [Porticoccaceae bacterium]OUU39121.1 MAG: DUF2065 domain-containing protein [Cellvibrionales bacterium TMED49]|tara:strand:+ start:377 stop:562 length:186 start_codon:yes stop_codon:yes gene_type:complete